MGWEVISGQVTVQRLVRPVSVVALPDSLYFSRLLPSGVKMQHSTKMTENTKLTPRACAGLFSIRKNIISETKLATIPPLVPASIMTTTEQKAQSRNQG